MNTSLLIPLLTLATRIDSTIHDGSYGRLLNDNHRDPNVRPKLIYVDKVPHIAFFAVRNIHVGDEITFNYDMKGDGKYWWRNEVVCI